MKPHNWCWRTILCADKPLPYEALSDAGEQTVKGTSVGRVWVFDAVTLEQALEKYQAEAEQAYPQQHERIGIAVAAIKDFLNSHYADAMTMNKGRSD